MIAEREKKVIVFPSPSFPVKAVKRFAASETGSRKRRAPALPARQPSRRATDFPSDSTAVAAKNRPGEAVILAHTGKTWREWFVLLNGAGTERSAKKKIIAANTDAKPSWREMVLIAYEMDDRKREQYCQPGGYEICVSKTVAVPVANLFEYWANKSLRERWLGKRKLGIRESTPNKGLQIGWEDDESWLSVNFQRLDPEKSRVVVKHIGMPQRQISSMKDFWRDALDHLKAQANAATSQAPDR